jgi:hypothetical protein
MQHHTERCGGFSPTDFSGVLFLLTALPAQADRLMGRVLDAVTKEPLSDASVSL